MPLSYAARMSRIVSQSGASKSKTLYFPLGHEIRRHREREISDDISEVCNIARKRIISPIEYINNENLMYPTIPL